MRAASVLRRLRRAVLAAATLAAFACVICWLRQPDAETAGGRFDRGENAIRFDGSGGSTHPDGDIALRQRFDTLKRNRRPAVRNRPGGSSSSPANMASK